MRSSSRASRPTCRCTRKFFSTLRSGRVALTSIIWSAASGLSSRADACSCAWIVRAAPGIAARPTAQPAVGAQTHAAFSQLTLDIGARDPEPYEEALFELGALSVTLLDAADNPVLEPAPGETPLWPTDYRACAFRPCRHRRDSDRARTDPANATRTRCQRRTPGLRVACRSRLGAGMAEGFSPDALRQRLWVCPGGQQARRRERNRRRT